MATLQIYRPVTNTNNKIQIMTIIKQSLSFVYIENLNPELLSGCVYHKIKLNRAEHIGVSQKSMTFYCLKKTHCFYEMSVSFY